MQLKLRRWTKVECSPSDTPPILLPGICLHCCHSRPTRFARTRRSVTAWQTPGSLRMSGDAQSGSAFHLLPAVFRKLKNLCQARRLRGGIMCGRVFQPGVFCIGRRTAALRGKKSVAALLLFYFLLGMMCRGRGMFQPGVFCICRRTAAWKVPGKLRWNWMPPVRA